ncbi:MAG: hypothetical protein IKP09_05470 [Lentisphaeria bacterium]|nr:hypothetical protein [Lentisphaeria bacterium]
MMFRTTDGFEQRDGEFSAAASASARNIASFRIASDAIIGIIITKAAR